MKVYLVRHAQAVEESQKGGRPLTPEGRLAARQLGRWLKSRSIAVEAIWHSPKLRSIQTAKGILPGVQSRQGLVARKDLTPMSRPGSVLHDLERQKADIMLVGHLPHLLRLAGKMLNWKGAVRGIDLAKPGVLLLERQVDGTWIQRWMIADTLI